MKQILFSLILVWVGGFIVACGSPPPQPLSQETLEAVAVGDVTSGEELYRSTCLGCHGEGGVGITGLSKPIINSEFVASKTDKELILFFQEGRPADHPLNTTGVAMPPMGINPNLTPQDLADLVAYTRALQNE